MSGPGLTVLNFSRVGVTGEGLADSGNLLPELEIVQFDFCEELTDRGLGELLQTVGQRLTVLDVRTCAVINL